jgi:hypothetical protein
MGDVFEERVKKYEIEVDYEDENWVESAQFDIC